MPDNWTQGLIWLLDHCDLQALFFTWDHAYDEVDLLGSHLPIASEAFLNVPNPPASVKNGLFQVKAHLDFAEETEHGAWSI